MQKRLLASILGMTAFYADAPSVASQPAAEGTANTEAPKAPEKAPIPPSPLAGTVFTPTKFHFKKDELGEKRPTVELLVPTVTMEGLVSRMQDTTRTKNEKGEEDKLTNGEKVQNLVLELLRDLVAGHVRQQVSDEKNPVNKQEELDLSKLDLTFIANIPPAERRGGGISKETWEAFFKNYTDVMPEKTGKKKDQVENAAKLFVARLQPVKTQKKILDFLKGQLALWFASTTQESQEEFAEVYEFLNQKIDEFMKRDEAELLQNL